MEVARHIEEELKFRRFEKEALELYRYHQDNFETNSPKHKAKVLSASLSRSSIDVSDLSMTQDMRIIVGVKLISTLIETTGLFTDEHFKIRNGKARDLRLLVPTEETKKWMEEADEAHALHSPLKRPMVVPPLDWDREQRGGYRFGLRGRYPLVRKSYGKTGREVASRVMPTVYQAVNRIQATPWRVNQRVLEVVEEILLKHRPAYLDALGLSPPSEPIKPPDIQSNEEARKRWREDQKTYLTEINQKLRRRRRKVVRVFELARTFDKSPAIYFPHNLDFRGRVYPIPSLLQPQGDDLAKGLLTFARGQPIGARGATWLAMHGANCLDETDRRTGKKLSKLSIDERVRWIEDNTERIERVAEGPFDDTWWIGADAPLQFLAFCFEWAGYAAMRREGRGDEYICALPVAMDGTCNGIQHLSAMLLDKEGGSSVNLTPGDRPQDFYQYLADGVLERLEKEGLETELARRWLTYRGGLVNRKLAKGPGMTFSYGAKQFGFAERLEKELEAREDWPEIEEHFSGTKPDGSRDSQVTRACQYLAGQFYEVLKVKAEAAVGVMEWLSEVARIIGNSGQQMSWEVPHTGFKVAQTYWEKSERQVETKVAGKIYKPASGADTDEVDVSKHASAVAANVVHSLDAAALMLAVQWAATNGMDRFAMVHDSYGTVPAECDLLAQAARQGFYRLYCQRSLVADDDMPRVGAPQKFDIVDELERQFQDLAGELPDGEQLPARPARIGSLDPGMVLVSMNFMN